MADKVEILITADDRATGVLHGLSSALGGLGTLALGALAMGAAAATVAIDALGAGVASSVQSAMESQDALAQLNAVIESTGAAAGVSAEMATDLADSLQQVTRFSDEEIIGGENLLLTFTKIGQDIFPEATEVMLDMSQALGQDLKSSAIQLGKALQDPILGVTALRRVAVNFGEAEKDMITAMVEAGDLMGAQKFILQELQVEFGGAARAAGQTFAGQLDILRNRFDEIKEELGLKVIPLLQMLMEKIVKPLIPFVEQAAGAFGNLFTRLTESKDFQSFVDRVADSLKILMTILTGLMQGNITLPDLIQQIFGGEAGIMLPELDLAGALRGLIEGIDWAELGRTLSENLGALWNTAVDLVSSVDWNQVVEAMKSALTGSINAAEDFWSGIDWAKLSQDLAAAIQGVDWVNVGQAFANAVTFLSGLKAKLVTALTEMVHDVLTEVDWARLGIALRDAIFEFILGAFGSNEERFTLFMEDFWSRIAENALNTLTGGLLGNLSSLTTAPSAAAANSFASPLSSVRGNVTPIVIQLTYAPALSAASQADVERLMPLIQDGVRRALRNNTR